MLINEKLNKIRIDKIEIYICVIKITGFLHRLCRNKLFVLEKNLNYIIVSTLFNIMCMFSRLSLFALPKPNLFHLSMLF